MTESTPAPKASRLKFLAKWLAWTAAAAGALAMIYVGCAYLFAPELPPELLSPPEDLVSAFKSQRAAAPPPRSPSQLEKPRPRSGPEEQAPPSRKNMIYSYQQYLEALSSDHPDRTAIDLYQELYDRFYRRGRNKERLEREFRKMIGENWIDHRRRSNAWKWGREPVPSHVDAWMSQDRVSEFIELSGQFADTPGPPVPIIQPTSIPDEAGALRKDIDPSRHRRVVKAVDGRTGKELGVFDGNRQRDPLQLHVGLMKGVAMMMAAEGRRCLEEDEPLLAFEWYNRVFRIVWMLRFSGTFADETHDITGAALDLLTEWIEDIPCSTEIREQWLASLDEMHPALFSRAAAMGGIQRRAISYRRWMADTLNTTWGALLLSIKREYYHPDDIDIRFQPPFAERPVKIQIDRFDKMAAGYILALNDRKKAPEFLKDYDTFWEEAFALSSMPYPEIMEKTAGANSPQHGSYEDTPMRYQIPCLDFRMELMVSLAEEARFNLLRAALTASLGTNGARESAQPEFVPLVGHPWRDPFTAKCLKSDRSTSPTLIFSLGPDMTSQGGKDTFRFQNWRATYSAEMNLNRNLAGVRNDPEGAEVSQKSWRDRIGVEIPEGDFSIRVGYQR